MAMHLQLADRGRSTVDNQDWDRAPHPGVIRIAKRWPVIIAATVSLLCAAPAAAAPVDAASDHAATVAYHRYLSALVSNIPASRSADDALISSIAGSCPNVLAAVNLLPVSSVNKSALLAFGEEIGGDVAVAALEPDRGVPAQLARALTPLRWSSRQSSKTITRYLASTRKFFGLRPSDLCGDAQTLAASAAQATPPGTLQWLASFGRYGTAWGNATSAFIKLLERYQTQADGALITEINQLVRRWRSLVDSLATTEVPKLASALGISV